MHHIDTIRAMTDDIAVRDLYLIIGTLSGVLSVEQAVMTSRSNIEYFVERLEIARRVARMEYENEREVSELLSKAK